MHNLRFIDLPSNSKCPEILLIALVNNVECLNRGAESSFSVKRKDCVIYSTISIVLPIQTSQTRSLMEKEQMMNVAIVISKQQSHEYLIRLLAEIES